MGLRTHIVVLLVGLVAWAVPGADGAGIAPRDCVTLPKPRMRVRLTVSSDRYVTTQPTIRAIIQTVWGREGITIDWIEEPQLQTMDNVDAWIFAAHSLPIKDDLGALGAVYFKGGRPGPLVRLSIDSIAVWVRNVYRPLQELPRELRRRREVDPVTRALGYVAAHELGHVWLGMPQHAGSGLMQQTYRSLQQLDNDPAETSLDASSKLRLLARMSEATACR
jgi:hypothetical protein